MTVLRRREVVRAVDNYMAARQRRDVGNRFRRKRLALRFRPRKHLTDPHGVVNQHRV